MTGSTQLTLNSDHRIHDHFGNHTDERRRAIRPSDRAEPRPSARILAVRDGETKPLYDRAPEGLASPSPTLLIERHSFPATSWQTIVIPHQVISLSLVTSSVEYELEGGKSKCTVREQGTVTIEKRDYQQRFRWSSSASTLSVELADTVIVAVAEGGPMTEESVPVSDAARDSRLSSLLYALENERLCGYPSGPLFTDAMEQALAAIVISYEGIARRRVQVYKGGMTPYQMKRVNEFVSSNLTSTITLKDLAEYVGLSTSHFCSLFRKSTGVTPHHFVLASRIAHSKSLLTDSNRSLLDVAFSSGFRTHQHFSRIFRRIVGVSPREYRSCL
jgi:AraC family transcriptional regulator